MLQKPKGYEEVKAFTEFEQLETGGHALNITNIEPVSGNGWEAIDIFFDTTKTDKQPNYFSKNHTEGSYYFGQYRLFLPDESKSGTDMHKYSVSALKQFITSVEHSNKGFKFDWSTWDIMKGKQVGASFGEEEYLNRDNEVRTSVKLRWFCSVDKVADQKIPKVKKLKQSSPDNFLEVDETALPFDMA